MLSPLDEALEEQSLPLSGLQFPPKGWAIIESWGNGWALVSGGLKLIIDCEKKSDNRWWVHISVSRKHWPPSHQDMIQVKQAFLGDRYAYAVYPPKEHYVNIHPNCLHLWSLAEENSAVLPEFSTELGRIGKSI